MLARPTFWSSPQFYTYIEKIGENLLKVVEMLLHALSLVHPQLVELSPEEESIGEGLRHIQLFELRSQHCQKNLAKHVDHYLICQVQADGTHRLHL